MFDLKWIRENPDAFDSGLARRGLDPLSNDIIALDSARRDTQTALQEMQAQRNDVSKKIGAAKANGENAKDLIGTVAELKKSIQKSEESERQQTEKLNQTLSEIPNLPDADVPDGSDESENQELRTWGEKPNIGFDAKEHFELGEALRLMDFEAAARISGSRFVVLKGALAKMERALGAFMIDIATDEFEHTEIAPPLLVRDEALFGTGQLPKFADDLFRVEPDLWLIPTAEVSLTNIVREQILDTAELPMRLTALTPCFRSEAGASGKDTRGMFRQHQFNKVELVSIVHPDNSIEELDRLTACAEEVLKKLGLHYRVVSLCTGDLGFSARKTYDIEVWLPGQDRFREISSCSQFGDFQARRMDARFKESGKKGTEFVHTLNGSGLAVGRTLIAVLENYQQADGSIAVPDALQPYMGGLKTILAVNT